MQDRIRTAHLCVTGTILLTVKGESPLAQIEGGPVIVEVKCIGKRGAQVTVMGQCKNLA